MAYRRVGFDTQLLRRTPIIRYSAVPSTTVS